MIVAAQFRRYYSGLPGMQYESGICFFTPSGRVENYPKQHSANGHNGSSVAPGRRLQGLTIISKSNLFSSDSWLANDSPPRW